MCGELLDAAVVVNRVPLGIQIGSSPSLPVAILAQRRVTSWWTGRNWTIERSVSNRTPCEIGQVYDRAPYCGSMFRNAVVRLQQEGPQSKPQDGSAVFESHLHTLLRLCMYIPRPYHICSCYARQAFKGPGAKRKSSQYTYLNDTDKWSKWLKAISARKVGLL